MLAHVSFTADSAEKYAKEEITHFSAEKPQATLISTDNQLEYSSEPNSNLLVENIYKKKIEMMIESHAVTITMSIATLYALFGDDIKNLSFAKSTDDAFDGLVVVCITLFTLELVVSFICKNEYRWSFYFWLDVIATITLIADLTWMWDAALGLNNQSSGNYNNNSQLQSASDASNAGKKTAKALVIIRLIRLVRIVKLYKNFTIALKKVKNQKTDENDEIIEEVSQATQTNVGKKMSEVTMKRVIILVLALLFILPFFQITFYYTFYTSWDFGVAELNDFLNYDGFDSVRNDYWSYHINDIRPIVYLSFTNESGYFAYYSGTNYTILRYNEIEFASDNGIIAIFDLRYDTKLTSSLNIMRTIFVSFVLTLGAIYFTKDAEELVIKPIEKMLGRVKIIAANPLAASELQNEPKEEHTERRCCGLLKPKKKEEDYETQLLENTIIKIGVLLALSFGEAGSVIIGSNVEQAGELDPMNGGNKVVGIFGFCDIRNFTDTTEELQEGVMMFVNEIAEVVHGLVDKYLGAANKNIGDAFLLVWKFTSDEFYLDEDKIVRNPESIKAKYIPDLSLISFLKILAKVNKDPAMLKYRTHQKLLIRMPNYEVKMGFGMHLGWAIEGAIGSQFKIDASYLSPNVNVASALEGSTKIYGVPLLISGPLYEIFSEPVKKYCRHIDTVLIKGNSNPIKLYTSDCDFSEYNPGKLSDRSKMFFRKKKKILKKALDKKEITTEDLFIRSKELTIMKKGFSEEFFLAFEKAINEYLAGDWANAKAELENVLTIRTKDGPSISLINYMSENGFKAPSDWKGFRYLG
jgi:class 3 adenylate cyclase